jgi:hypothetical protein
VLNFVGVLCSSMCVNITSKVSIGNESSHWFAMEW